MALYPFLFTALRRTVFALRRSSTPSPVLLALTLCVAGFVAIPSLSHPAWAAQQEKVSQEELPPDLDEAEPPTGEAKAASIVRLREAATADVEAAVATVAAPDPQALAKALGVEWGPSAEESEVPDPGRLEPIGDLNGDGVPETILKWTRFSPPSPEPARPPPSGWILFLLSWDGTQWQPTNLTEGGEPFTLEVLPLLGPASRVLVVLTSVGGAAVPYPVLFEYKNHAAPLLWDSRADESRYQGYKLGSVEFRDGNGDGVLELIATGRADPGLVVFPPEGRRGFEACAVYGWDGKAYVPTTVEYSANEDYALYRFISALHLRDFRSAYTLIDPAKFLGIREPSLEAFRKQIESTWPEFLGDSIFEARDSGQTAPDDFSFELKLGDKLYVYRPTFSAGPSYLLTGLERREGR